MYPQSIKNLISSFSKLPGIGNKAAERLVFYLLKRPDHEIKQFAEHLINLKHNLNICQKCFRFANASPCSICTNNKRKFDTICVVAESKDIALIEKTEEFSGVYHVLNGLINPLENIRPQQLTINALEDRIKKSNPRIREIILALNPNVEGESTILYLTKLLSAYPIKITRLAQGLPSGAELDYSDPATLARAYKGRTSTH